MITSFHFETAARLKQRILLKQFLKDINATEGNKIAEIMFVFCSDDYLLRINKEFLNHDYLTDIITFEFKKGIEQKFLTGEIYISVERVAYNAVKFAVEFEEELHRVIFHGVLHLLGYKDKTTIDKTKMRKRENHYLKKYKKFVPRET